jgi:GTPase SAR1 family protein
VDDQSIDRWDTAGQEQFRCISKAYFRGASGSILAFDLSSKESFDNTRAWLEEVLREVPTSATHTAMPLWRRPLT